MQEIQLLQVIPEGIADSVAERVEERTDRYGVATAGSVESALRRLDETQADCIVATQSLPDGSGVELLERLRNDREEDLPFVLLDTDPEEQTVVDALNLGADQYLSNGDGVSGAVESLIDAVDEAVTDYRERTRHRESRGEYERLFAHMQEGVGLNRIVRDGDGTPVDYEVLDLNPAAREILDIDSDSRLPFAASTYFEQERPPMLDRYAEVVETGESMEFETDVEAYDRRFRISAYSPEGDQFAVVFEDVTDRHRRKRDLELFRTLMDRASDAIFVIDSETGRFEDVNETACDRLGYDRQELLRCGVWEISGYFQDSNQYRAHLGEKEPGETMHAETTHRRKDGSEFPVEIMATTVTVDGQSYRVALARDITERKEQKAKLRAEKERLAEFASVLSHDLRTPLEVARGRIDLARGDGNDEHLATAAQALGRMDDIVDDVLTLAREGQTVDPESLQPVSLSTLSRECWQTVSTNDASLDVKTNRTVVADRGRLRELLENLYRNAVKHGGDDVTVTVDDLPGGFSVADDGCGIPEDEREAVFEAGYSTSDDGSGLGLSIVESIAEAHGWSVAITESDLGGARFEFTAVEASDDP